MKLFSSSQQIDIYNSFFFFWNNTLYNIRSVHVYDIYLGFPLSSRLIFRAFSNSENRYIKIIMFIIKNVVSDRVFFEYLPITLNIM